jgi:DNA-binding transcriptional MocR family regulator
VAIVTALPRYRIVARQLADLVRLRTLRPGDRLPSVRRLSRERDVSVATAVAAYLQLEADGLVESRPRSGFFVRGGAERDRAAPPARVGHREAPARVSISPGVAALVHAMQDPTVLALGATVLAPELLPLRALNRTLSAIARSSATAGVSYGAVRGVATLRRQLARRSAAWGTTLDQDSLLVTVGAMEALVLALRAVTAPGDVVAVESPTYFGVLQILDMLALRAREIPCRPEGGLDVDALAAALVRTPIRAVVASPTVHNPLGARMPDEQKQRLVRLLARHDVPLVEDDVYGELAFDDRRPTPAQAFDRSGRVLLCGSISKTLAPGYRVGWLTTGRYGDRIERLKFAQTVATPALPQMAVAEFLASGRYDRHLRRLRRLLAAQVRRFRETAALTFPAGTTLSRPEGGCFLWAELPRGVDSLALQTEALRHRIALAPGPIFSASKGFRNCLRVSCGLPWSPRIERALTIIGELAHRQLGRRS